MLRRIQEPRRDGVRRPNSDTDSSLWMTGVEISWAQRKSETENSTERREETGNLNDFGNQR